MLAATEITTKETSENEGAVSLQTQSTFVDTLKPISLFLVERCL